MPSSLIRYEVLLPVKHNDGSEVDELKHRLSFEEASDRFGGVTLEPQQLLGLWIHQGKKFQEPNIRIVIEVEDTRRTTSGS